jgi:N-acyl-phosphatidylethanolamine-hydrolysing phospholipase D
LIAAVHPRRLLPAFALAAAVSVLAGCAPVHKPDAPDHHTLFGFRNPAGSPERNPWWKRLPWIVERLLAGRENWIADIPDSHVVPEAEAIAGLDASRGDSVTWIGHMTTLLNLGGRTILTDPWFSDYASPIPPVGPRRYVPPGIPMEALPPIDVVLISHNHYEHLDLPTVAALPRRDRIAAVVPLGLGDYFREHGYGEVIEMDWYETRQVRGLTVTAMPVIHWSKRSLFRTNDTLWAGFSIDAADGRRVYFGGDAEYGPIYREIAERHGGFDLAILSIGAFLPRSVMHGAHCIPEDCLKIGLDLDAELLLGVHWGTVRLGDDGFDEAPRRFRDAGRAAGIEPDRVWTMRIGETRSLPAPRRAAGPAAGSSARSDVDRDGG